MATWNEDCSWIENVRTMLQNSNSQTDWRDAFIRLAYLHAAETINAFNLKEHIVQNEEDGIVEDIIDNALIFQFVSPYPEDYPDSDELEKRFELLLETAEEIL